MLTVNVERLKARRDFDGLGKLLRDKDSKIHHESAHALIEIIVSSGTPYAEKFTIASQFKGVEDQEIVSILMRRVEKHENKSSHPYTTPLLYAVIYAGGANDLIEFHKNRNFDGYTTFHEKISDTLIAYAAANDLGLERLLDIIPYAVCQYTDESSQVVDNIEQSDVLVVSKDVIEETKNQLYSLPEYTSGLSNYSKQRIGKALLSKLQPAS